ncbi:MAG: acyloxyacyl hydrolase [Gammaproteobacteria bacterium]|nr:acyloxyacyl hydrolase [Gammaproteobacteria bacterium]MDH4310022.1 acyloxyacyl hydrolase [Gammaproteobacteria bacterium]MDH5273871.1 acyloxyacyl hydrolase [Gammaproteobacteria bacterium]
MRPVAALLLGGLISCCGSGGTASAQAAETSQSVAAPADSVRPDDAPVRPSHAMDSPSVLFAAGVFALVEAYDYPYSVGVTYVARPMTTWRLAPGAGFAVGPDGIAFLYLDLRRDFALGERWYVTPSLSAGWFLNGDVIGPRDHLEFQSGIQFARRFDNGLRLGLAGLHISNGGLEHPNNGTEAVLLTLQVPLQK